MLQAPISWGELIDKITILEIKRTNIANEAARLNVSKELILLQQVAGGYETCPGLIELRNKLKAINLALWKIEDAIRQKERKSIFDAEFIELARSVYKRNDERAFVKRQINNLKKSEIIEEKSFSD